jgi:hypothetical protein
MKLITINLSIDLDAITEAVENSGNLNDNQEVFKQLAVIQKAKDQLGEAADAITSIESTVKSTINSKAKALYGDEWAAIKGDGYKITRSGTGPVYEIVDTKAVADNFLKKKVTVDSDAVKDFIKANNTLPTGTDYTKQRGESIRITIQDDTEAPDNS